jgi:hypothetical protein
VKSLKTIPPILTTGKKLNKLRINIFFRLVRKRRSQGKHLPPKLESETNSKDHSLSSAETPEQDPLSRAVVTGIGISRNTKLQLTDCCGVRVDYLEG